MAIQNRRGTYNNFDPQRLVPGEWAVVLSGDPNSSRGRAVYMAFEAGDVERMATYEDMEENIESAVTDIQEQFTDELTAKISAANTATQNAVSATQDAQTAAQAAQTAADTAQAIIDAGDAVTSWNGRAGTVTPQAGDYSANQITYKNTNVNEAISLNYSQITTARNNITTLQNSLSALRTELASLIYYEDVSATVSYEAGTIGARGAAVNCGTTIKSGYTYIGMFIINHTNTSNFSVTLSRNNSTNNAMLLAYRANGNAVSNATVDVRKVWIKDISAT